MLPDTGVQLIPFLDSKSGRNSTPVIAHVVKTKPNSFDAGRIDQQRCHRETEWGEKSITDPH